MTGQHRAERAPWWARTVRLGAGAIAEYIAAGWRLTPYGRLDLGQCVGPCSRCSAPTVLYGRRGHPHCPMCRRELGHDQAGKLAAVVPFPGTVGAER